MNILLVITKSEIGGAQVFVLNLANSLKKSGFDVEVAAGYGDYLFAELNKRQIPYYFLNSLKRDFSILNSFYFIYDLYRLLKRKKYDIIHLNSSNTLFGVISAYLLKNRPKMLFTFHGLSLLDKNCDINYLLKLFSRLYFKIFLKFVHKSVFVSEVNYEESKKLNLLKAGRSEVIYNGLDEKELKFFSENDARQFFSDKCSVNLSDSFLIGSTGRLAYPKNYEFLISNFPQIINKIPNAKIVIIGDGPKYENYKELIHKYRFQNDILLIGSLKHSYMYIKAFNVFTLPSLFEGLSISLIEAIFAEIPILASDVGGNSEIVSKSSGQLYKLNDIDDYISKLIVIKDNQQNFAEYNKSLKHKFSLDKMARKYLSLYRSLITNSRYAKR